MYGKVLAAALLTLAATSAAQPATGGWRNAPEYLPLFVPTRAHAVAYHVYTSPLDLGTILQQLANDPSLLHPPGAWAPLAVLPLDGFGQTGRYDRWKVTRLYGARRAVVARGPRADAGGVSEAWTLISPYPDPTLGHLESGTLLIVLDLKAP